MILSRFIAKKSRSPLLSGLFCILIYFSYFLSRNLGLNKIENLSVDIFSSLRNLEQLYVREKWLICKDPPLYNAAAIWFNMSLLIKVVSNGNHFLNEMPAIRSAPLKLKWTNHVPAEGSSSFHSFHLGHLQRFTAHPRHSLFVASPLFVIIWGKIIIISTCCTPAL